MFKLSTYVLQLGDIGRELKHGPALPSSARGRPACLIAKKGYIWFSGYKYIHDKRGFDILPDGTHGTSGFMSRKEQARIVLTGSIKELDRTLLGKQSPPKATERTLELTRRGRIEASLGKKSSRRPDICPSSAATRISFRFCCRASYRQAGGPLGEEAGAALGKA